MLTKKLEAMHNLKFFANFMTHKRII